MFARFAIFPLTLALAAPAAAELPDPVRAMIESAIATGDPAKVAAVIEAARATNPGDLPQIDALDAAFQSRRAKIAEQEAAAREQELRQASLLENWSGKGEVGAFNATGNSSNTGLTAGLGLERQGIAWSHKLRAQAEYQRSGGLTSREQYFASWEPRYKINPKLFAYGLAQYENDRFQGFSGRYAVSGGLGYQIIDKPHLHLAAKAGPAYRVTKFNDGMTENRLAALAGMDFDWSITDRLKLTQDANAVAETGGEAVVIIDSANTSVSIVSGLDAKVSDRLTARLSYAVEYDSNPPPGAVNTDTLSRFTLVYGF